MKAGLCGLLLLLAASAGADEPSWAYPASKDKIPFPQLPADAIFHVEGSPLSYSGDQLNKMENPVDWLPRAHPPPPGIVTEGDHARQLEPCGACHGIGGEGQMGPPSLSGLPADYIAEQLREFASGRRMSSVAGWDEAGFMIDEAKKLTEAEIEATARYFSALGRHTRPVTVIETDQAPATRPNFYGWLDLVPGAPPEPLGRRVVEVAKDLDKVLAGDPYSPIIAYVPKGAVERGKALAHLGAPPCVSCHGAGLKGMGKAPPLAGRDPHYLARALWDIKTGARRGPSVAPMQRPIAAISADQIADIVAYLASLPP